MATSSDLQPVAAPLTSTQDDSAARPTSLDTLPEAYREQTLPQYIVNLSNFTTDLKSASEDLTTQGFTSQHNRRVWKFTQWDPSIADSHRDFWRDDRLKNGFMTTPQYFSKKSLEVEKYKLGTEIRSENDAIEAINILEKYPCANILEKAEKHRLIPTGDQFAFTDTIRGQQSRGTEPGEDKKRPGQSNKPDLFVSYKAAGVGEPQLVLVFEYKPPHKFKVELLTRALSNSPGDALDWNGFQKHRDELQLSPDEAKDLWHIYCAAAQLQSSMLAYRRPIGVLSAGNVNLFLKAKEDGNLGYHLHRNPPLVTESNFTETTIARLIATLLPLAWSAQRRPDKTNTDAFDHEQNTDHAPCESTSTSELQSQDKKPDRKRKHEDSDDDEHKGNPRGGIPPTDRTTRSAAQSAAGMSRGGASGNRGTKSRGGQRGRGRGRGRGKGPTKTTTTAGKEQPARTETPAVHRPDPADCRLCKAIRLSAHVLGDEALGNYDQHLQVPHKPIAALLNDDSTKFDELQYHGGSGTFYKVTLPGGHVVFAKGAHGDEVLRKEEECYNMLSSLQGSMVPVSLGVVELEQRRWWDKFFLVISHGGSHVGPTIKTAEDVEVLKRRLQTITKHLHLYDVSHRDIIESNVVTTEGPAKAVLIDFELSAKASKENMSKDKRMIDIMCDVLRKRLSESST